MEILQSHTDHYSNTRVTNWKKLTTEELNRSTACHRSTQAKNKRHMPVHKTHHSTVRGSIIFPRDHLQFCYCPGCFLEVKGFHHTSTNLTPEKNTCICSIDGRVGQTASLDTVEKRKIPCPYQHSKL
jgi:hypothetical protein